LSTSGKNRKRTITRIEMQCPKLFEKKPVDEKLQRIIKFFKKSNITSGKRYSTSRKKAISFKKIAVQPRRVGMTIIVAILLLCIIFSTNSKNLLAYFTDIKFLNNFFSINAEYIVTFDSNTGTGTMPAQTVSYNVATPLDNNVYTKEGYFFAGWNTSPDGSGTPYAQGAPITNIGDITLYAQWAPLQTEALVTFLHNDGTGNVESRTVSINEQVGTLPVLTRTDYEFLGWYTEETGGTKISENEIITQDVTYYGRWNRLHYDNAEGFVFDGSYFFDTDIRLFNDINIGKNFEISFELSDIAANQKNQATILNSMQEVSPYPGFVFRVQSNGTQIEFNAPKISNKAGLSITTTNKVTIKRINDVFSIQINDGNFQELGKYNYDKTFDETVVLGASPDVNPIRYFKGTLTNINIDLWEPDFYTVKYEANGGTGTMPDQEIRIDENKSLSANAFTREDWAFTGWNTEPDGNGTAYSDKEAVTNIAQAGENVTLYAQWTQDVNYSVRFNSNGGTGTMPNQNFEYAIYQNLSSNVFEKTNSIFMGWNTKADGSGTDYLDGQSVKNLTQTNGGVVDLYAIWTTKSYFAAEYVFDGTNYVDTNVYLFEPATINRDFEISFEITTMDPGQNRQATFMNAMDETGAPYPGVVYRLSTDGKNQQIGVNADSNPDHKAEINYGLNNVKINIKREDGVIYLKLDDGDYEKILDMSTLNTTFHVPVTFGSSLTGSGNPQRFFKGKLSNLSVEIF